MCNFRRFRSPPARSRWISTCVELDNFLPLCSPLARSRWISNVLYWTTSFASVRPLLALSGYQHVLYWTTSFASVRPLHSLSGYQHMLYWTTSFASETSHEIEYWKLSAHVKNAKSSRCHHTHNSISNRTFRTCSDFVPENRNKNVCRKCHSHTTFVL